MPSIHASFRERFPSGHQVWSMHRPDERSEEIVLTERRQSYLRCGPSPPPADREQRLVLHPVSSQPKDPVFDVIYAANSGHIRRWAAGFFHASDHEAIEDAIQDVWLEVHRSLSAFTTEAERNRKILNRIAFRLFCTRWRGWQSEWRRELKSTDAPRKQDMTTSEGSLKSDVEHSGVTQTADDQPLLAELYREDLAESLSTLSAVERQIVSRHWSGEPFEEIKVELSLTQYSVYKHYHAAEKKISSHFRERFAIAGSFEAPSERVRAILATGTRFGFLRVLEHSGKSNGHNMYRVQCDRPGCGTISTRTRGDLGRGSKSCACACKVGGRKKI